MSANMGCDVLADVGFFFDDGELACVGLQGDLRKVVIVLFQYVYNRLKKHDVELCSCFDTGGTWKYQVAAVFFCLGKIGCHEVGI